MRLDEISAREATTRRKPERVVDLPLACWADIAGKPSAPIPIGIRLPAEGVEQEARSSAEEAVALYGADASKETLDAIYNDALIASVLAHATCQSMDVEQPFFANGTPEIARRLTRAGLRRLWDELETLRIGSSPGMPELSDAGMSHLWAMWESGVALDHMPPNDARLVRRLLEFARQEMADAEERAAAQGVILRAG